MISEGIFLEILLFFALAAIVFFRLFNVLGSYEFSTKSEKKDFYDVKAVELVDVKRDLEECPLPETLNKIKKVQPLFSYNKMLVEVQQLFLSVIKAFYRHDKATLKKLLDPRMYELFINNFPQDGVKEPQISFFVEVLWLKGEIKNKLLFCDFKIVTERRNTEEGRIILEDIVDFWTVSLQLEKNNNWILYKTGK